MFLNKFIILFLFFAHLIFSQNILISGKILDTDPIQNVVVKLKPINISTTTNKNGEFKFSNIPYGNYIIACSHLSYKSFTQNISSDKNIENLIINLEPNFILLGEAIVVSSMSQSNIKNLPLPIEYIENSQIEKSTNLTVSEMLKKESGISVINDGPWATTVNIRGLSKQNLVYLVDGNRIETSTNISAGLSLFDMNDLESIEIIKGGLSSLYGSGATGGIVNIQTKKIELRDNFFLSSQFINSYNSVNNGFSNYLNLSAGKGNWGIKLNGGFRRADDTIIPDGKLNNSSFQDENLNAALLYALSENVKININYQKFSAYNVGIPGGAPFPSTALADYKYAKRNMFSAVIDYANITDKLISAKLKYYNQKISRSVEIKPNALVTSNPVADHLTNGALLETHWIFNNDNYFLSGIDFWQREYNGIRTQTNTALKTITVDKPVPNSTFRSFGLFAKDELKITNKLNLTLSGRYDLINIENEKTKNPLYTIKDGVTNSSIEIPMASFDAYNEYNKSVSGGIGAIYKFNNIFDYVFNAAYNFRSPSLEERYQYINLGGIIYLGNPELNSEEGLSFDTGFRIWSRNLNCKFNLFFNSFSNLVIDDVLIQDSIYVKNNVGKAELYGFDSRIDFNFYNDYLIYTNISYVRGEDKNTNSNLPEIPPLKGTFGISIPVYNYFTTDLSVTFAADQNNVAFNESKTKGFAYYDFTVTTQKFEYGLAKFNLVFGMQNIFDRKYLEHLSTYRGMEMFEPGRNIFAKLVIEFN